MEMKMFVLKFTLYTLGCFLFHWFGMMKRIFFYLSNTFEGVVFGSKPYKFFHRHRVKFIFKETIFFYLRCCINDGSRDIH